MSVRIGDHGMSIRLQKGVRSMNDGPHRPCVLLLNDWRHRPLAQVSKERALSWSKIYNHNTILTRGYTLNREYRNTTYHCQQMQFVEELKPKKMLTLYSLIRSCQNISAFNLLGQGPSRKDRSSIPISPVPDSPTTASMSTCSNSTQHVNEKTNLVYEQIKIG